MNHPPQNNAMVDYGKFTNAVCRDVMRRALQDVAGPGAFYTYDQLADLLDIELRTLKAYALGECLPALPVFLKLCAVLGPDFTQRFLRIINQSAERL